MSGKKSFSAGVESFINGRGFYIVLFACIAVIGVSAWILLFSQFGADSDGDEDYAPVMADMSEEMTDTDSSFADDAWSEKTGTAVAEAVRPVKVPELKTVEEKEEPVRDGGESGASANAIPDETDEPESGAETISAEKLTFIWPVSGSITAEYSPDTLQYSKTLGDWRTHSGVDIGAQLGVKVMAVAAGTVEEVCDDDMFGTTVRVNHGGGLVSVYSNLAAVPTVKEGDAVTMGSVIGSVGDTALAEAGETVHLHFEMEQDGVSADPAGYLPRR